LWTIPARAHDHAMSSASNPRITLELEPGADPIRGSIEHGDGTRESFWGWLELIDELGRIATDSRSSPPSQARHTRTTRLSPTSEPNIRDHTPPHEEQP
jgi:hypothetical protein